LVGSSPNSGAGGRAGDAGGGDDPGDRNRSQRRSALDSICWNGDSALRSGQILPPRVRGRTPGTCPHRRTAVSRWRSSGGW
jgi:hypothetical protein